MSDDTPVSPLRNVLWSLVGCRNGDPPIDDGFRRFDGYPETTAVAMKLVALGCAEVSSLGFRATARGVCILFGRTFTTEAAALDELDDYERQLLRSLAIAEYIALDTAAEPIATAAALALQRRGMATGQQLDGSAVQRVRITARGVRALFAETFARERVPE